MTEVWVADVRSLRRISRRFLSVLERGEEEHAGRIRSSLEQRRYLTGRIFLRLALSRLIGGDPQAWRLIIGETGKVNLAHLPGVPPVNFDITHSGASVVVAISSSGRVDVDVKEIQAI